MVEFKNILSEQYDLKYQSNSMSEFFSEKYIEDLNVIKDEVLNFKDKNLKEIIKVQLQMTKTEILTKEKMLELRYLNISNRSITSLEGLEFAENLSILNLFDLKHFDNDLSPLQGLRFLTRVNLGNNNITDISPLRVSAHRLKVVNLENNYELIDVSIFDKSTNIEVLNVNCTAITDAAFIKNMKKLKMLSIGKTKVKDIEQLLTGISSCRNLSYLSIAHMKIRNIEALRNLTEINQLDISFNSISDLRPLSNLVKKKKNKLKLNAKSQIIELPSMSSGFNIVLPIFNVDGKQPKLRWLNEGNLQKNGMLTWNETGMNVVLIENDDETFTGAISQKSY